MKIVLGSDHAGYDMKKEVAEYVRKLGHQIIDVGTNSSDPVDYPDFAEAAGKALIDGRADRGIVICGSGVGASVAANKLPGVRAGLCHDTYSAHQGVEHDAINVLVMGARIIGLELARELVRAFLSAEFSNGERHLRRLQKVEALESRYGGTKSSQKKTAPGTDGKSNPRPRNAVKGAAHKSNYHSARSPRNAVKGAT